MARQQTNQIIEKTEKNTTKRRDGTIHQGHFSFIVSLLLSSHLFLFLLFISPFERSGFSCVVQGGGMGRVAFQGVDLLFVFLGVCLCPCLCNYIQHISMEEMGWAIIGLTMWAIVSSFSFNIINYSTVRISFLSSSDWLVWKQGCTNCCSDFTAKTQLVRLCFCWKRPPQKKKKISFFSPPKSFSVPLNLHYYVF